MPCAWAGDGRGFSRPIHAERHSRATIVSFSDILMVHRQEVLKRDGP